MSQKVKSNKPFAYIVSMTNASGESDTQVIKTVDEAMLLVMDLLSQMHEQKLLANYKISGTSKPMQSEDSDSDN